MKKIIISSILLSVILSSIIVYPVNQASAQIPVTVTSDIPLVAKEVKDTIWTKLLTALNKAANRTWSSLLSKYINQAAEQSAVYLASGLKGQKPAFLTMQKGEFWKQVGNEAAGAFIENFFSSIKESTKSERQVKISYDCNNGDGGSNDTRITLKMNIYSKTDSLTLITEETYSDINIDYEQPIGSTPQRTTIEGLRGSCEGLFLENVNLLKNGGGTTLDLVDNSLRLGSVGKLNLDAGLNSLDICQPSNMMVALKIGLGLPSGTGSGSAVSCNWLEMRDNWDKVVQESILDRTAYLNIVKNMFQPGSNDLSIAYSLGIGQTTMMADKVAAEEGEINLAGGFITNTNVGGRKIELPGATQINLEHSMSSLKSPWLTKTGDAFIDAANVFISVLSNKLYERGMKSLLELIAGKPDDKKGSASLVDFYSSGSFGQAQSEALMAPLTDMNFGPGQDMDLLSSLASCSDINNPGPMNCVINNNFIQAISQELTVGEALQKNLINKNARFGGSILDVGFNIESGDISWRAMKILRKYRILPVGWELAAERLSTMGSNSNRVSIGDVIGCYSPFDKYETNYNQEWCQDLIDPNWPLKAPLSYCAKSGFGNQIDYIDVITEDQPETDSTETVLSTINLLRAGDYCADEQSCIKEGDNNRCDVYGYCLEDRRTWQFPSDTCQPQFNTCQSYTDWRGQTTAYLGNTLDYANCNADNSGCTAYCYDYNWASSSYSCLATSSVNKYYLSGKAETCSENEDGCSQLIRLTNGNGVNLLFNGDFEFSQLGATSSAGQLDNWFFNNANVSARIVNNSGGDRIYSGEKSLKIINSGSKGGLISFDWSRPNQSSLPKNLLMRPGVSYTLSAYVYSQSAPITMAIGNANLGVGSDFWLEKTMTQTGSWQKLSVTLNNDEYYNANAFAIYSLVPATFYVDNIMLEIASQGNSGFNRYRQSGYFYEKLMPDYLQNICYQQVGNSLIKKTDAPWQCDNYARTCLASEVDCQMFTSRSTGDQIPAKTNLQNYCPSSCVGFASFWQQPTQFNDGQEKTLIPQSATTCSAQYSGCTEFTNLDNLASGGENREYFSYLRQCIKPTEPQANCAEFYMWQNTATTGLQLRSYTWQAANAGQPQLIDNNNNCVASSLQSNSLDYNPDCREVRNQDGDVFYVPYSKTISCSADCRNYRLSDHNIDDRIINESSCQASDGHWLSSQAACVLCKGTGQWDDNNQACIYKGLPSESTICSAEQNGCRNYSGTGSANWRLVINDNFDSNTSGWTSSATSSETIRTSGYSLLSNNNNLKKDLPDGSLSDGLKYRLQFFAKSLIGSIQLTEVKLRSDQVDLASFNLPSGGINLSGGDWGFYSLIIDQPIRLSAGSDHQLNLANQNIYLSANGRFLIDEIRLMEVVDEYYLLKNSLVVPSACNSDYNGSPAAGFMLGCQEYRDQNNNTHYLHGFTDLCQESAVGCEALINTNNYSNYYYPFKPTNSADDYSEITPVDEVIYATYDRNQFCAASDKGCQRLGKESTYQEQAAYETSFLKFDPDRYRSESANSIKCLPEDVGCQTWNSDSGLSFFKDPQNQLCEWKSVATSTTDWYKRSVKFCSESSPAKFCLTDQDCSTISSSSQCVLTSQAELCPTNDSIGKTIGLGGNIVKQPIVDSGYNWTGLCPATQSGCTEYLDPLSRVNGNLLGLQPTSTAYIQEVDLEAFTAYVIQAKATQLKEISWQVGAAKNYSFWLMDKNNQLISTSGPQTLIIDAFSSNDNNHIGNAYYGNSIFITNAETKIEINIPAADASAITDLALRKIVVNYNINKNLTNDGCTDGKTEYDGGCLLFNERTYNQGRYPVLTYDTDLSANDNNGISPQSSANNTANRLIKVKPSRVCGKWLECTTYSTIQLDNGSTKKVCSSFGLCDQLDANNNCANFIDLQSSTPTNQTIGTNLTLGAIRNFTGYSKVGYNNTGYFNDLYNLAAMSEQGTVVEDADLNGSFESVAGRIESNGNQLSYNYSANGWSVDSDLTRIIVSPQQAVTIDKSFANDYLAPDGNNFLRLATRLQSDSTTQYGYVKTALIPVNGTTDYSLSGSYRTNSIARAGFKIWEYTCQNPSTSTPCRPAGLAHNITNSITMNNTENKWRTQSLTFQTKPDTKYIQIELDTYYENGVAYFDNIQLNPVLNHRENGFIAPSCRLYPEGNSLSCDYGSSNNPAIRKKGLLGYCLEYDPANEKNCLLWYPLDKIGADPIEEGVGYNGKFPLYYCLEATTSLRLEYRHAFWKNSTDPSGCPPHYFPVDLVGGCSGRHLDLACIPRNTNNNKIISQYNNWTDLRQNYCNKDVPRSPFLSYYYIDTFCMECGGGGSDNSTANVNSVNDGWYLYDEALPTGDCGNQGLDYCAENNNQYDCLIDNCNFNPAAGQEGICQTDCHWTNEDEDLNFVCSSTSSATQCLGSCGSHSCTTPHGKLEIFNDAHENDTQMGRGPRLRSESFSASTLKLLCESSGFTYDEGQNICFSLDDGDGLLGKEIYRDQFSSIITNNENNVPDRNESIYCTKFAKVVNDFGTNVFWADRVKDGSTFPMPCYIPNSAGTGFDSVNCLFSQSSMPFASAGYPAGQGTDPASWDSLVSESNPGNQPLFYQDAASGVHLGKIYSVDQNNSLASPKYLFAKSYGIYQWNFDSGKGLNGVHDYFVDSGQYNIISESSLNWEPPTTPCSGSTRPASNSTASYCLINPVISNVKINDRAISNNSDISFNEAVFTATLSFNSRIDNSQKPLKRIQIDWGDGSSNYDRIGNFIDRPDIASPHLFTHRYSCQESGGGGCQINNLIVTITDNWDAKATYIFRVQPGNSAN